MKNRISSILILVVLLLLFTACENGIEKTVKGIPEAVFWFLGFVIVLMPLTALIGLIFLIYKAIKMYHQRIMASIQKGDYVRKPLNWKLLSLLVGLLAIFISPGVTLVVIREEGLLTAIGWGFICLLGGSALLIFRALVLKYYPEFFESRDKKD